MKFRITTQKLFVLTLLLSIGAILPNRAVSKTGGQPGGGDSLTVKLVPVPPVNPDTGNNAFAKLVVKNLGPVVNSSYDDLAPTVTADGRTMFFVSDRPGGLGYQDFWESHSPENDDTTWGPAVDVTEINSDQADGAASIAADGQTIYFASNRNTTVKNDVNIWVATLDGTHWKNVHEVGAPVNTTAWETQPAISPDDKKLFFASKGQERLAERARTM